MKLTLNRASPAVIELITGALGATAEIAEVALDKTGEEDPEEFVAVTETFKNLPRSSGVRT